MDKVFKEFRRPIRLYMAVETVQDPYEKNVVHMELNPLPIQAIVTDLVSSQIQWKMPGIVTERAKEVIAKKKYKNMVEQTYKIEIDGEMYEGWKQNGKLQVRVEQDYIRFNVYIRKINT